MILKVCSINKFKLRPFSIFFIEGLLTSRTLKNHRQYSAHDFYESTLNIENWSLLVEQSIENLQRS